MPLLNLPNEILLLISECLPPGDLVRLMGANHHLSTILGPLRTKLIFNIKDELLIWAAKKGHEPLARQMLELGADVEVRGVIFDSSPLEYAADRGHEGMAKLLLEYGAKINGRDPHERGIRPKTPLQRAALSQQTGMVSFLLEKGADITIKDNGRHTALFFSLSVIGMTSSWVSGAAKLLMDKGAKLWGGSALHFALYYRDVSTFEILLRRSLVPIDLQCRHGYTCLSWAVQKGKKSDVSLLLKYGASTSIGDRDNGKTPLHHAAFAGNIELFMKLIEKGADFNALDFEHSSVLRSAIIGRQMGGSGYTIPRHTEVINLLKGWCARDTGPNDII